MRLGMAVWLLLAGLALASVPTVSGWAQTTINTREKHTPTVKRAAPGRDGTREAGKSTHPRPAAERYVAGEVVVSNLPPGFASSVRGLGFRVLERVKLAELKLEVMRLRIPRGSTVPQALKLLARYFPGIDSDASHLFGLSGDSGLTLDK
ncbi:MAG: hypothetical protein QF797_20170 [Alphaproteobacteria bacterium]|jgi:hypothetical protein|nr:hypothetical protein [Alphaproteobacteria bacterium]MDP6623095.1 hypothetical protein [Alphaproteobacteria bacterium]